MVLDRIKEYIDYKGISTAAFERSIGMSNASFGKSLKNRGGIGSDKIERILLVYPELSAEWLFTGNGEMLKPDYGQPNMEITPINQSKSIEKKEETQTINLYDFRVSAGLKTILENSRAYITDTIRISNLPKCDGGIYAVGNSMYPLLRPGDIILYKIMPLNMQNLMYGQIYIISYEIEGDDFIVIKYIRKSNQGEPFISLESENPEHAPMEINFQHVSALALVRANIHINA
jgi:transcriptional regulator